MSKTVRLILAFFTMVAGAAFFAVAVNAPAQASPYGHPFKCITKVRTKTNGVTISTIRCSGQMEDGTYAKYQCRQSPVAKPCKGPALPPTVTAPPPSSGTAADIRVMVVLHSTPRILGSFAPDSKGVVAATLTIPAGFTGNHTIEARLINTDVAAQRAANLSATMVSKTTRVMMPFTVGKDSVVSRTAALPVTTDSSSGFGGVAVIGLGALGVVMLIGGGLLFFAGHRRRVVT